MIYTPYKNTVQPRGFFKGSQVFLQSRAKHSRPLNNLPPRAPSSPSLHYVSRVQYPMMQRLCGPAAYLNTRNIFVSVHILLCLS